jgi:drug/metabolite transporter (DMT)-like permease
MLGVIYMIVGSMSIGCSFVYARKFISLLKFPAVALATYQIGLAMIFLFLVTSLDGSSTREQSSARYRPGSACPKSLITDRRVKNVERNQS